MRFFDDILGRLKVWRRFRGGTWIPAVHEHGWRKSTDWFRDMVPKGAKGTVAHHLSERYEQCP